MGADRADSARAKGLARDAARPRGIPLDFRISAELSVISSPTPCQGHSTVIAAWSAANGDFGLQRAGQGKPRSVPHQVRSGEVCARAGAVFRGLPLVGLVLDDDRPTFMAILAPGTSMPTVSAVMSNQASLCEKTPPLRAEATAPGASGRLRRRSRQRLLVAAAASDTRTRRPAVVEVGVLKQQRFLHQWSAWTGLSSSPMTVRITYEARCSGGRTMSPERRGPPRGQSPSAARPPPARRRRPERRTAIDEMLAACLLDAVLQHGHAERARLGLRTTE
jgi:hypothetical protein